MNGDGIGLDLLEPRKDERKAAEPSTEGWALTWRCGFLEMSDEGASRYLLLKEVGRSGLYAQRTGRYAELT